MYAYFREMCVSICVYVLYHEGGGGISGDTYLIPEKMLAFQIPGLFLSSCRTVLRNPIPR